MATPLPVALCPDSLELEQLLPEAVGLFVIQRLGGHESSELRERQTLMNIQPAEADGSTSRTGARVAHPYAYLILAAEVFKCAAF